MSYSGTVLGGGSAILPLPAGAGHLDLKPAAIAAAVLPRPAATGGALATVSGLGTPRLGRPVATGTLWDVGVATSHVNLASPAASGTGRAFPTPPRTPGSDGGRVGVFSIPRVVQLVWGSSISPGQILMNYPVNRTVFRVVRGTRNDIEFHVRDIDRKPVLLTTETLSAHIVDSRNDKLLLSRELVQVDPTRSLYRLTILPADLLDWPSEPLRWSVSAMQEDGSEVMLYTDRDYTPYSHLEVMEGPRPGPAKPVVLDPETFVVTDLVARSGPVAGSAALGYPEGLHTVQALMEGFTGTLVVEATLAAQPLDVDWFEVSRTDYEAADGPAVLNLEGHFMRLRVGVMTTSGRIAKVFVKA